MPTLDQTRATLAWEHVAEIAQMDESKRKKYGTIVHALTPMLRTAGLSQSLHFVLARNNDTQVLILNHLAAQLSRVDRTINGRSALLERARVAELSDYLRLSQEALRCLNWYRRFVQGVLKVEADQDSDD